MNLKIVELDEDIEDVEDVEIVEDNIFYRTVNKPQVPSKPLITRQIPKPVPNKPSAMQIEKPEKKNISYDDILSSLNMTIVNGKLQIKRADSQALAQQAQKQIHKQQMNPSPPPKPLTREEYKEQLARQYLQKQTDLRKLQESKSKKLMFSNAEISVSPLTMNQNTNHLFKFIGSK
jgi:hypothetical protein